MESNKEYYLCSEGKIELYDNVTECDRDIYFESYDTRDIILPFYKKIKKHYKNK